MKLSKKEVQDIAKLARIELSDQEIDQYAEQLSDVFEFFEKLQKVNTDNVEITSQVTGLENVYREDNLDQCDIQKELINQSAETEDGQIKTKNVF